LRAQEKVPKEKGTPVPSSAYFTRPLRSLALHSSPIRERAQLGAGSGENFPVRLASNRVRALFPDCLRYSVRAKGFRGGSSHTVGAAERRRTAGKQASPCRAGFANHQAQQILRVGERPAGREAQGTRVSGQAFGAAFLLVTFLLVTFLWRRKKK